MGEHLPVLSDLLAAGMLAVALYCAGRLLFSLGSGRATDRDADAVHTVMGVSMAGMLTPRLDAVPTGVWVVVFAASTLWFGWRAASGAEGEAGGGSPIGQHVPHLLMSAAMVYVLVVAEWAGSMSGSRMAGMSAVRWPLLTVALAVLLLGDGVITFRRNLRQMVPQVAGDVPAASFVAEGGSPLAPAGSVTVRVDAPATMPLLLAPRAVMVCQLVMSVAMGYMLLSLL
jgi:Domain of unknown function (DUF5134)